MLKTTSFRKLTFAEGTPYFTNRFFSSRSLVSIESWPRKYSSISLDVGEFWTGCGSAVVLGAGAR